MKNLVFRQTVDDSIKLTASYLLKNDFFKSKTKAVLTWGMDSIGEYSLGLLIKIQESSIPYIRMVNIQEYVDTGTLEPNKYTVILTTTTCNYGGLRYWFKCPTCQKRKAILYKPKSSNVFACRKCHDLTYLTKSLKYPLSRSGILYPVLIEMKLGKIADRIVRSTYAGKPTKRQKQYNELENRLMNF